MNEGPDPSEVKNPESIYLDSNFYLDYLIANRTGHEVAVTIIDAWLAGAVEVVTSALTITEVLYVPLEDSTARIKIDRAREADIIDLFMPTPPRKFRLVEVDRRRAEESREYFWVHDIRPKDAIHIACAVAAGCPVMFSRDNRLIRASGLVGGNPPLQIRPAQWVGQQRLDGLVE